MVLPRFLDRTLDEYTVFQEAPLPLAGVPGGVPPAGSWRQLEGALLVDGLVELAGGGLALDRGRTASGAAAWHGMAAAWWK